MQLRMFSQLNSVYKKWINTWLHISTIYLFMIYIITKNGICGQNLRIFELSLAGLALFNPRGRGKNKTA